MGGRSFFITHAVLGYVMKGGVMRACAVCGGSVPAREQGRPAVYCSRSCQARAYRARKAGQRPMSGREAARLAAFHAGLVIESALAGGWETLDRYGDDRPRVEAALAELCTELERRAQGAGRGRTDARDESLEPVRKPAAAEEDPARAWEGQAEFERRLKPARELGKGYQVAEWPGTGRHYLVYRGERIGHVAKKPFTTVWEAYAPQGIKLPATGTYKTRREALIQVAVFHKQPTRRG
jgi:hypothetical protein